MTIRTRKEIKRLYFVNHYLPVNIARLFGLSHVRILQILAEEADVSFYFNENCTLCTLSDAKPFYIDGNEDNNNPQNVIYLCPADERRIIPLQRRRTTEVVKSQY